MKKTGILKTILVVALIALMLVIGFVSAKYVQSSSVGSFNLTIEKKAYTYNLIDGPSFNRTLINKASNAESLTFCSKVELDQTVFNDLTLTHVGVSENDAVYLGVSSDEKTAYVIADSNDPNQKIIANGNCSGMLYDCYKLTALDLSGFDTSNVWNMEEMFRGCSRLSSLNLSGFNTSSVLSMISMFYDCSYLTELDLSNFNTANLTEARYMFLNCENLHTIYASNNFTTERIADIYGDMQMFDGCINLVGGKGTVYDSSHIDKSYAHIDGGTSNPGYFTQGTTFKLIDGSSFNSIFDNKAPYAESLTFCSKAELDQSIFNGLTLTHIGATENDAVYLGVSSDEKTAYVIADSDDPNQKIIANKDCSKMFSWCYSLIELNLSGFNTATATDMSEMFFCCDNLTELDLSSIDTRNVTNMYSMFDGCGSLTDLDLSGFNTSKVTNMGCMFNNCDSLTDLNLSSFNTSNVTDMNWMFHICNSLTILDLSGFNTANVTNMDYMFEDCRKLQTIYASNNFVAKQNGVGMFAHCDSLVGGKGTTYDELHIDQSYAHIDGGTSNPGYFTDKNEPVVANYILASGNIVSNTLKTFVPNATTILFGNNQDLENWKNNNPEKSLTLCVTIGANSASDVLLYSDGSTVLIIANTDDSAQKVIANEDCSNMFAFLSQIESIDLSGLDTSNTARMDGMFYKCENLTNLNLSNIDTTKVTNMYAMFYECKTLKSVDLSSFNTNKVTNMSGMFGWCDNLEHANVSNFNTENVTDMNLMFVGCRKLAEIDVSGFKTGKVTNMYEMFYGCETVKKLDVASFDTALVENMSGMFYECKALESIDLSSFNTSKVTDMSGMFGWCEKLTQLDISSFDTGNVTDMHLMFTNSAMQTIYASENFITDQVANSDSMFNACVNLVGGKGTIYDNSNIDKSYAHIDGGTNNPGYFTDKNAQDNPTIIDTPVLLTWMNTLMTWGEKKELKAVINDIDNTDGLQTILTIENEAGGQIQEPVTLTAKNNEWTVLIDTFAFTEGVYKVTVSEITDPSGEREFTGGFVSSSCVIRISPCQISFSDASTAIGAGTSATITGAISGLPNGDLPDCFNLIKVNLVDSYGEITQVPMQIIREEDQAIYRFDIPNNLKAGVYKVYVNLTEVSGYVIGPNDSLEPNIGTIIVSFNTNSLTSLPTETNETNKAEDPGLEPVA